LHEIRSAKKNNSFSKSNGCALFLSLFLTKIQTLSSGFIIFWIKFVKFPNKIAIRIFSIKLFSDFLFLIYINE
jgi:hypothetical protein